MKKIVFRTADDEFISEVKFEDFDKLYNPSNKIHNVPDISFPRVFDELIDAIDVLIPCDGGKDFIFIKAGSSIRFLANGVSEDKLIGRTYGDIFPQLFKSKHFDRYRQAFLNGYMEKCNISVYENDILIHKYLIKSINDQGFLFFYSQNFTDFTLMDEREKILFNESSQGIVFFEEDGALCRVNEAFTKETGYTLASLNELGIYALFNSLINIHKGSNSSKVNIEKIFNHEELFINSDLSLITKSGEIKWFKTHSVLTEFNGRPVVQTSFLNITESKNKELHALALKDTLFKVQDVSKIAISHRKSNGQFVWTSEIFNILEISEEDYLKSNDIIGEFVIPEDRENRLNALNNLPSNDSEYHIITRVRTATGKLKYLSSYNKRYFENGNFYDVGFVQDITQGKIHENELKSSALDKKVLLQEAHHRIKNNLQIILSMLSLELRFSENNFESAIEQTRNRIKSIALIHEKVYQSVDVVHVNIKEYVVSEINSLKSFYDLENIHLNFDIEDINIHMNIAIPLGLILNELFINTVKYAFPNGQKGEVNISFKLEGNKSKLIYGDSGIGLSEGLDIYNSPSFGLTIINTLIDQLNGTFKHLDELEGTVFEFEFEDNYS